MKRIGLITSGGDAPGMNAAIRAIVKTCLNKSIQPVGYFDGYDGVISNSWKELTFSDVDNIIQRGGTILGTARSEAFRTKEGRSVAIKNLLDNNIDGFICIGGDGSFTGASILSDEMNIPVIGIPGTIDNDIYGTDKTIGYDTALNTVVGAVDNIRDTASSHHRIFFIEVMGRDAGFIALNAAIASGAESVLIPEEITDIQSVAKDLKEQNKGKRSSIVIVSEGDDGGGAKDIMLKVQPYLTGYSLRHTVLGHVQRGGAPSAIDRILATLMGNYAVESLLAGKNKMVVCSKGDKLNLISIKTAIKNNSIPDLEKLQTLKMLRTQG
jgi:6-phosphofructokinase 1